MLEFTLNHPLMCSVDRYWALFLDREFTRSMLQDGLGFGRAEVGDLKPRPGKAEQTRAMRAFPKLELPAAVARIVGDALAYLEDGTYDASARRWTFQSRTSVLGDRFRVGGRMWAEATPSGRSRRVSEIWIEAKMFGIGGLVERAAESNIRDGYRRSALWINRFVVSHPLTGECGASAARP